MNPVIRFIRSDLYKNFWKFTIVGAFISGLLVCLSGLISMCFTPSQEGFKTVPFIGFYGFNFGFIAAFLGFWIMYFLERGLSLKRFSYLSVFVGFVLATLVVIAFYGTWEIGLAWERILFPGIPYFGSIYFFRKFSIRYIQPLV